METFWTRLGPGGRVVVPAPLRKAMGLREGDELLVRYEEGELRLQTRDEAIRKVQALVRQYVPDDVSLVDDLLADRRREVEQEEAEAAAAAAAMAKRRAAR